MQPTLMNKEDLQQWILRKLGAPFLKVELSQDNLDDCVEDATRWFSSKKGFKTNVPITVSAGVQQYNLADNIDTVLDVTFGATNTDYAYLVDPLNLIGGQIPTQMFGYGNSAGGETGGFLSTYVQFTQYLGMARRILNADLDWVQVNRDLIIMPPPKVTVPAILNCKMHAFTIEQLKERDHDLVKRMSLAFAKEFISRLRTKYANFPGAQGNISVDGPALAAEAERDKEKLEQEIFDSDFPLGFLIG